MIDHTARIEGVVKGALKEASMGEPVGYAVSLGFWPIPTPDGGLAGPAASWFVFVSIRNGLDPQPIGHGFPVIGLLPSDDDIRKVAQALLEKCRQERDQKNAQIDASLKGMSLNGLIK